MNLLTKFATLTKNFKALYFGSHSIVASTVTGLLITSITIGGVFMLSKSKPDDVVETTKAFAQITTVAETTELETTTVVETTTVMETTTEEPTTQKEIQTIPIEKLKIAKTDVEVVDPKSLVKEEPAPTPAITPAPTIITTAPINEVSQMVKGIDVSKWQGKIDWAKVKADGVTFAIIKAAGRSIYTDELYPDPKFQENIEGALQNGIQVGVYFFSQAITPQEALEEASYILSLIKPYKLTYPVVFDWETSAGWRSYVHIPKDTMNQIAYTFCDLVKSSGYTPMIYGNTWDLANRYNTTELSSKYKIWIARYSDKYKNTGVQYSLGDPLPAYNYPFQMWQYSSTGKVNGIAGNVDMNIGFFSFNGSLVPSTPVAFKINSSTLTYNVGTAFNISSNFTAFNTAGLDATSQVKTEIFNSSNQSVAYNDVIMTPGLYRIKYTLHDFTGVSLSKEATLIIRSKPIIEFTNNSVTFDTNTSVEDFRTLTNSNIKKVADFEGNNLLDRLGINYDTSLNQMVIDNKFVAGNYTILYGVTDNYGVYDSKTLNIIITEAETTTDTTTTDTTTNGTTTGLESTTN